MKEAEEEVEFSRVGKTSKPERGKQIPVPKQGPRQAPEANTKDTDIHGKKNSTSSSPHIP